MRAGEGNCHGPNRGDANKVGQRDLRSRQSRRARRSHLEIGCCPGHEPADRCDRKLMASGTSPPVQGNGARPIPSERRVPEVRCQESGVVLAHQPAHALQERRRPERA
jgi:hypothetical protein